MPDSVVKATDEYRSVSDRILMFSTHCLRKERGKELRSAAIYKRYQDWCAENGFRYENAANFNRKLGQLYVYVRRKPWSGTGEKTTMVNDVTWVSGEEVEEGLIPEFSDLDTSESSVSSGTEANDKVCS